MAELRIHRRSVDLIGSLLALFVVFGLHAPAEAVPPKQVVENFQKARTLLETEPQAAYELAREIPRIPEAEDVRLELLIDASVQAGRVEEAIKTLEQLEKVLKDSGAIFERRLERAELLAMLGKTDESSRLVGELLKERRNVRGRGGERRYIVSRLLRLQHDLALAAEDERRAKSIAIDMLIDLPAEIATKREGLGATPDDLSQAQRLRRARNLDASWDYHLAREEFERFKNVAAHREEALWNLGLIGLRKLRDRPKEAEEIFKELSKGGRYAEDSLFFLARAYMVQERYDDARKTYAEYSRRFPRGKESVLVDYYDGWLYYDHRENEKAIEGFDRFIAKYGRRSSRSSYIYGFRAWAFMRLQQWEKAIAAWDTLLPFGNPLVEGKAYYWQAYAWKQLGDNEKAIGRIDRLRDRWPLTYYSMLGEQLRAEIQGTDPRASKVWWPEGGGNTDDTPRVNVMTKKFSFSPADQQHWERVKTLSALNERHKAREGFGPLKSKILAQVGADEKDAWIHALGFLVGDYNEMYSTTWNSITGYPGMARLESGTLRAAMSYPRAYKQIVENVAAEFDFWPGFVWSIMRQESRYKPGAVSGTDAIGALQMIPQTARKVAQDLGTVFNVATFFRPEVGFRFSAYYMRKLLDTYSGLWVPTASSYNTGPGPIARWFKKNPDASFPWLIEEFEYNEGRAYGRKVAEHMLRYLYLYESDPKLRADVLDNLFPLSRDIEIPEDVGY